MWRHLQTVGPALAAAVALAVGGPGGAAGQDTAQQWMERCEASSGRGVVHCEVRESLLAATGSLSVNAGPNGGVRVEAWDRNEVRVVARVQARAPSEAEARALAREVTIGTDGNRVRSTGPARSSRSRQWSVSYDVYVPRATDLDLEATNGGLSVRGVEGRLELETTNGGISLENVAGDVRGETTNGGLSVKLDGTAWNGRGLDLETTNGGVSLSVPDGYSAHLEARTVNGRISTDVPLSVQGEVGRRVEAALGTGGAPIRVSTTNGAIRVRRGG